MRPNISTNSVILERAAVSDELAADFLMTVVELHIILRSEVIGGPRLSPLSRPTNPAADQVTITGIPAAPSGIEVVIAGPYIAANRVVGIAAFDSQIQL